MRPATPDQPDEGEELMSLYISEAGDPHVEPAPEHVARLRSLLLARLETPAEPSQLSPTNAGWAVPTTTSSDLVGTAHPTDSEPVPVSQQAATPPRRSAWRPRARLLVGSGMAALAIVVVLLALGRPGSAWAQVARALQERPWIHGTILDPDGKELVEQWFSLNRELGGERAGTAVSFHDYKNKVMTKYAADENTVYLLPEPAEGRPDAINFLRQVLDVLRDPKGPGKFPFPGMELIDEARREMTMDGKKWLGIELTLRVAGGSRGEPVSMQIRVDLATKLPVSFAMVAEDGKRYTASIDYPDQGPADIYDLGVPRTATVVERMVSDDVRRVLAGLKAGRREFDDYCVIVVEERILPTNYLPMTTVLRVWRKGPKWRIDRLRPERLEWAPPPDTDTTWWQAHQDDFEWVPKLIGNGKEYWDYYLGDNWKPGMPVPKPGKPDGFGQTVGPNPLMGPGDDPVLPFWCQDVLPEQAGHPTAGVDLPDNKREFLVEPKASGGPAGTILLRGRDTNPRAAGAPDYFRLWVDPEANYISMRTEIRVHEPSANRRREDPQKVAWIGVHILEAVEKSPKGNAYPTRTRQIMHNGQHEMVRKFFVDFEAEVPDDLFQPLK